MDYGIVAFLDILGFSAMVKHDSSQQQPLYLPRIAKALEKIVGEERATNISLQAFSDSIIIDSGFSPADAVDLIEAVRLLQRELFARGILIRGAVALGKHHRDKVLVFSEALVSAYTLERERARFPRVLVDQHNLLNWLTNHDYFTESLRERLDKACLRDRDGQVFISYADGEWLDVHHQALSQYLRETKLDSASVLEKAQWVVDYHNYNCHSHRRGQLLIQNVFTPYRQIEFRVGAPEKPSVQSKGRKKLSTEPSVRTKQKPAKASSVK